MPYDAKYLAGSQSTMWWVLVLKYLISMFKWGICKRINPGSKSAILGNPKGRVRSHNLMHQDRRCTLWCIKSTVQYRLAWHHHRCGVAYDQWESDAELLFDLFKHFSQGRRTYHGRTCVLCTDAQDQGLGFVSNPDCSCRLYQLC